LYHIIVLEHHIVVSPNFLNCSEHTGINIGQFVRKREVSKTHHATVEERKVIWALLGVMATVGVVAVALFFFSLGSGNVSVSADDGGLHVDAPLVEENISYDNIISIEMREDMDFGSRISGFGGSKVFSGKFSNSEFGDYTLACYKTVKKYIVVERTADRILVLNQDSIEKTLLLYDELLEKLDNV
jgi:hypothetical protein